MYSEPPQGRLGVSQAGDWTGAALPGCQLVGQPGEAALIPDSSLPWDGLEMAAAQA